MKYDNYLDDRNDILRPRKNKSERPPVRKANHKHEYTLVESDSMVGYYSCIHCEKSVTRYL